MQRVVGQNPQVTDEQRAGFEPVDLAQWRALTLEMTKADGGRLEIELARPLSWLEFNEAVEGGWVYLDLEELGAVGEARVVGIAPCPPVEGDPASPAGLITGLFRHESDEVVDVHIAGLDEPIGTTANHPFWSEDAQAFVPASELGVGEQVRTLAGLSHVTSVTARGPPEAVYNLEVHGEHVYQVTSLGVLVHNRCQGVYVLLDSANNVKYVGRGDVASRFAAHARDPVKAGFNQLKVADGLTKAEAKRLEQLLMNHYGGAKSTNGLTNLMNMIRSYSSRNPNSSAYDVVLNNPQGRAVLRDVINKLRQYGIRTKH